MNNRISYSLWVFLAVVGRVSILYAQNSSRDFKLDSLLKADAAYTKQDSIKIESAARIAMAYAWSSDYIHALDYFFKAAAFSEQLNDSLRCMRFYGNIGIEYTSIANYPKALEYHLKALTIAEQIGSKISIASNLNHIGRVYMFLGDYPQALEYYKRALKMSETNRQKQAMARELRNIGNTYCKMGNYPEALTYLQRSQLLFEELGNKEGEAIGLGIIGTVYYNMESYAMAIDFHRKALGMNKAGGNRRQESMNLLGLGRDYRDAPEVVLLQNGIKLSDRYAKTMECLLLARQTANDIKDQGTEKAAWEEISITYEKQDDYLNAFKAFKNYIVLRDSIEGNEIKSRMAIQELQFNFDKRETQLLFDQKLSFEKLQQQELQMCRQRQDLDYKQQQLLVSKQEKDIQHLAFLKTQADLREQQILGENQQALTAQKDAELRLLGQEKTLQETKLELTTNELVARENQRNAFIVGSVMLLFLVIAIAMGLYRTSAEKKKSEILLLNILPSEVAKELKQAGESAARQYNHVTVLFTDFVNFTGVSEQLSPTELVAEIHRSFTAFDIIIERHGLEKIKTIGDAYLAVCGLPNETEDHAQKVIRAALDIQQYINEGKSKFEIRIGINSGPVVAGIVGVKKYAYDIWGDTVNTAARMEQNSDAGKINISGATHELIKGEFACEHRGKIKAKNKGEIDMYFVTRSFSEG